MHRSGFVALIGRPNVGKSTLLNALVGEKVAIITNCPQTTRNQIRAVLTRAEAQIIFIDTPGVHKPKHMLGSSMVQKAHATMQEVDLVCFLVEANQPPGAGDNYIAELLRNVSSPIFLILNKIDLAAPEKIASYTELYLKRCSFKDRFALSALHKTNLDPLVKAAIELLPEGPQYYPPDMITDQPERFIVAEIIREKIIPLTREEIPFSIAVVVEEMSSRADDGLIDIRAEIYVERKSQVGIVVGKGGSLLKEAGSRARLELEALLGQRIFLDLRVKVKREWRNREEDLRRLGYH
ncbi:MAG TPA: GTPase Era [Candidatus Limnocylindrales bacterium]|nr:GTPase Era [Candidatus Limnocylindrales bacterium]